MFIKRLLMWVSSLLNGTNWSHLVAALGVVEDMVYLYPRLRGAKPEEEAVVNNNRRTEALTRLGAKFGLSETQTEWLLATALRMFKKGVK